MGAALPINEYPWSGRSRATGGIRGGSATRFQRPRRLRTI